MGDTTGIAWTDRTWNPWVGCEKVSSGCAHCYMFAEQRRYGTDPSTVRRTKTMTAPLRWQREAASAGRRALVFTCSWSDFFIPEADVWRPEAWGIIKSTPGLVYQVLTKRADRIARCLPADWGEGYPNVALGVSAENQTMADRRIPVLLSVPARWRFVSAEPLLGPIDLVRAGDVTEIGHVDWLRGHDGPEPPIPGLSWVIVGGESGAKARPMDLGWARSIVAQCAAADVPVFVKQFGSLAITGLDGFLYSGPAPLRLRDRKGGDMAEWPEDLRVRQFPAAWGRSA